ncbi:MAG: response regulator [Gammaproteobacteria bacterium]|nr:response regulator [Gammaproteobacteria bacterium]
MKLYPYSIVKHSQEFYSAAVRLSLGLAITLYIWLGKSNGEFIISSATYYNFALVFYIITLILGLDLFRNPESRIRRYITLFFDFTCTTYSALLTGGGGSEFILIYIWLYIAYGTRYGLSYLLTAVILVMLEFNFVLLLDNAWTDSPLSSTAQIFVLIMMPLYLNSMIKQLRKAKKEAEQATRAKSSFLATMSHEIRTPMSGIIGTAHLLQGTKQNKEQKEYTTALLDASKSLHALIDDILDFSKIEANKLELQKCTFDLHHTVNEVVAVLAPNADQHNLDFIVYIDPQLPSFVIGDNQRIRQILFNLLGNAIKFTKNGEVSLKVTAQEPSAFLNKEPSASLNKEPSASLSKEPSAILTKKPSATSCESIHLRFDIIDTGIGIHQDQQIKIFDSFTQVENLQTFKIGGTGLGTTIAKQLVEIMGGQIGVQSEPGRGSHFWFTLSLPVEQKGNIQERYNQILSGKQVAILTCNSSHHETLECYCRYFGLTVERFYSESGLLNGLQQAIKHAHPFDLVILSVARNQSVPAKLAGEINALDSGVYSVPGKIFLSYLSTRADAQQLGGALFDAYITKPVNFERLGDTLVELLNPDGVEVSKESCCELPDISLNVLIAEDEDINAMVLSSFLQDAGHKTKRVLNGAQAVQELAQNRYDLAFMDMRMPEMNGLEATKTWREQEPKDQHIPIIALTANATIEDRKACLEVGMDDFITKPISPEQLSRTIQKCYIP